MTAPLALDLFCGAGGASMGLHRAGFEVVGVDVRPQPRYPFTFIQADALRPPIDLSRFAFIWASPPCQAYSSASASQRIAGRVYPDLVAATRDLLHASGCRAWVIENVVGAPVRVDLELDGTMFGLRVVRRRWFELSFPAPFRLSAYVRGAVAHGGFCTVVGHGTGSRLPRAALAWHTSAHKRAAMGIDWMRRGELSQAIPPAYSEFIARAAFGHL